MTESAKSANTRALWIGWIDYGKSYRPVATALAAALDKAFPRARPCIESRNLGGIRPLLEKVGQDATSGCHTMNDDLQALMQAKKVSHEDARKATTDRLKFEAMFRR